MTWNRRGTFPFSFLSRPRGLWTVFFVMRDGVLNDVRTFRYLLLLKPSPFRQNGILSRLIFSDACEKSIANNGKELDHGGGCRQG